MSEALAEELRGQINGNKAEVLEQVKQLISMGITPLALQIALQLPRATEKAQTILSLI